MCLSLITPIKIRTILTTACDHHAAAKALVSVLLIDLQEKLVRLARPERFERPRMVKKLASSEESVGVSLTIRDRVRPNCGGYSGFLASN